MKSKIVATPRAYFAILGFLCFAFAINDSDKASLVRGSKFQGKLGLILDWDEEYA